MQRYVRVVYDGDDPDGNIIGVHEVTDKEIHSKNKGKRRTYVKRSSLDFKFCIHCFAPYVPDIEECCCDAMQLDVPEPKPAEIDLCLFHGGCSDGHGSYWAVHWHRCLGTQHETACGAVAGLPCYHEKGGTDVSVKAMTELLDKVAGKNVLVADFSFDPATLLKIKKRCRRFLGLDHHHSAQEQLSGEPNFYFDMERSGTTLVWDYMETGIPLAKTPERPWLPNYIQDQDLYTHVLPDSKAINTALYLLGNKDLKQLDIYHTTMTDKDLAARGNDMLLAENRTRSNLASYAGKRMLFDLPCAVITHGADSSGVAAMALEKHQDCRIAAVMRWQPNERVYKYSVRGRKHDEAMDIPLFIEDKGWDGGGHKLAAGFTRPDTENMLSVFDTREFAPLVAGAPDPVPLMIENIKKRKAMAEASALDTTAGRERRKKKS